MLWMQRLAIFIRRSSLKYCGRPCSSDRRRRTNESEPESQRHFTSTAGELESGRDTWRRLYSPSRRCARNVRWHRLNDARLVRGERSATIASSATFRVDIHYRHYRHSLDFVNFKIISDISFLLLPRRGSFVIVKFSTSLNLLVQRPQWEFVALLCGRLHQGFSYVKWPAECENFGCFIEKWCH